MKYLRPLVYGIDVSLAVAQLDGLKYLGYWNEYKLRTGYGDSPHKVDDIWVRYRAWEEWLGIKSAHQNQPFLVGETVGDVTRLDRPPYNEALAVAQFVGEEHESVWYPAAYQLTHLCSLIFDLMHLYRVERLGGVLITRIPPGGKVLPHIDGGWHASYYEKIALQLKSAPKQGFCFADGSFECEPGTAYAFDNSQEHWVNNDSDVERVTCIICVRRDQRLKPLHRGD